MPVDKNKRMQPPKDQSFSCGISLEINVGKPNKDGIHRRKQARFKSAEELAIWYEENSNNKDARFLNK